MKKNIIIVILLTQIFVFTKTQDDLPVAPDQQQTGVTQAAPNVIVAPMVEEKEELAQVVEEAPETTGAPEAAVKQPAKKKKDPLIRFSFDNEDLVKIINLVASKKGINIILPQGADAINQKITFKQRKKILLSEAERYLSLFLWLSGYAMHPEDSFFVISKTGDNATRQPLPLYVNIPPQELPAEQLIQAVYYLANLRVPETTQNNDPLNLIIKDQLSSSGSYLFDPKSNAIIISERSNTIASLMSMILDLDSSGSKEKIEVVPLFNSVARNVAELLKAQLVGTASDSRGLIRTDVKTDSGLYFSPNIKIVADDRTNSLIIMGRETAVERLKDFVQEYMDASPESGRSILHAYDLQYLDAESFASVLNEIVNSRGASGQSQKEVTGPEQFFEGVKIVPEVYKPAEAGKAVAGGTTVEETGAVYRGGNRLIIAAKQKDWERLLPFIRECDRPEKQVIIEMLIVDLTVIDLNVLGSQIRNPSGIQLPRGVTFQSAQLAAPILDNTQTTPPNATTLAADLLRLLLGSNPPSSIAVPLTNVIGTNNGSTILSFNDPNGSGIWGILQILSQYAKTSVISHPFFVTLNNAKAEEVTTDIRRAVADQSIGEGAISTQKVKDFTAVLKVAITPRISSMDRLNLQITTEIENFISSDVNNFTRNTRKVQTSANMSSGQILVLGGLTQSVDDETESELPILGQIPILGWLFKSKAKTTTKSTLAIFITPTIVEPKIRDGINRFTNDKLDEGKVDVDRGLLFDNLKDPITRWFFRNSPDVDKALINDYLGDIRISRIKDKTFNEPTEAAIATHNVIIPDLGKDITLTPEKEDIELKRLIEHEENPLLGVEEC